MATSCFTILYNQLPGKLPIGTSAEIPTGWKAVAKIKIEPGTQGWKVLRLKGMGPPSREPVRPRRSPREDPMSGTPQHLSSEEKKMLEQLRQSANLQNQPGKGDRTF
jgi:molecular chaperone DnaJ